MVDTTVSSRQMCAVITKNHPISSYSIPLARAVVGDRDSGSESGQTAHLGTLG